MSTHPSSTVTQANTLRVIAIDGPAGAGKSSVSERLAARLGFIRLDTGALYRAIALAATRAGVEAREGGALDQLLAQLEISFAQDDLLLNGQVERESLRHPEVSTQASNFAKLPSVRAKLFSLQRSIGQSAACVVDGRDIGTVVFPDAPLKIYLTASVDERAHRRWVELQDRGVHADLDQLREEINARDLQDSQREIAPLKRAEDAVLVDATELRLEEVVEACLALARDRFKEA